MHKQFTRSSLSLQGYGRFSTVFTRAINTTFLKEKTSNNKKCSADGGGWGLVSVITSSAGWAVSSGLSDS